MAAAPQRNLNQKDHHPMKLLQWIAALLIILAIFTVPSTLALTVTAGNGTPTSTGAAVLGTNTADIVIDGATNAVSITVFYGGRSGGSTPTAWANYSALTNVYVNGDAYTNTLSGLSPGAVIYYAVRAQDLTNTAWSSVGSFTTATSAANSPDYAWRELIRTGTLSRVGVTTATVATGLFTRATITTAIATNLTATTGTLTTGVVGALTASTSANLTNTTLKGWINIGGTNYTPTAVLFTNAAGAEVLGIQLTP